MAGRREKGSGPAPRSSADLPVMAALGLAVAAPLLFGAVHLPAMIAVAAASLAAAATSLASRRQLVLSPLGLAAGLLGVGALAQLVPIPGGLLEILSPENAAGRQALRDLAMAQDAGGALSLNPANTALAAFRWLTIAAASLAAATALSAAGRRRAVEMVAVTLVTLGVAQVLLGLVQTFVAPQGTMFGLFETRRETNALVSGTFVNSNHAATLMAMAAVCAAGLALGARRARQAIWITLGVVCATGLVLNASRGGIVSAALAFPALALFWWRRVRRQTERSPTRLGWAPLMLAACLPVGLALFIVSQTGLSSRFAAELATSTSLPELAADTRLAMVEAAAEMITHFPLTGIGADAFGAVAPAWLTTGPVARFAFVESDPVELVLAFGIPLGGLALGLALLAMWRIFSALNPAKHRRGAPSGAAMGLAAALLAWTISSAVSFNVEILGLCLPALVAAEALLALSMPKRVEPRSATAGIEKMWRQTRGAALARLSPPFAAAALILLAAAAGLALSLHAQLEPQQSQLAMAARGDLDLDGSTVSKAAGLTPLDGHALAQAALWRHRHDPGGDAVTASLAMRAQRLAPAYPAGHLAAARVHARQAETALASEDYLKATSRMRPLPTAIVEELLAALPSAKARARAIAPRHDAIRTVMRALDKSGRHTAALDIGAELQSLHPQVHSAHYFTAQAALSAGEPVLAELYARHMTDAFPMKADSHLALSSALLAQKKPREALATLSAGVAHLPRDVQLRLKRAELLLSTRGVDLPERKKLISADLEHLKTSSILNKHTRAHFYYLSGLRWEREGENDRARADFVRAAGLRPEVEGYREKARDPHLR